MRGIFYGANEAKDNVDGHVPVFDLTPFVSLLGWITATNQFIRYGEGNELAELLKAYPDRAVQSLTEGIEKISDGLRLLRPLDVVRRAAELPNLFMAANTVISQKIPPFGPLSQNVERSYSKFGFINPDPHDVVHPGFRNNPEDTDLIKRQTARFVKELKEIAGFWDLPL